MKDFLDDSGDSRNDKMTKEDKIQILIKIVPILLIIVILLITLIVNKSKKCSFCGADRIKKHIIGIMW